MICANKELAKKIFKVRYIIISNQAFKDEEQVRKEFCRKKWLRNWKLDNTCKKTSNYHQGCQGVRKHQKGNFLHLKGISNKKNFK